MGALKPTTIHPAEAVRILDTAGTVYWPAGEVDGVLISHEERTQLLALARAWLACEPVPKCDPVPRRTKRARGRR